MREGWTYKRFEDCLAKAPKAKQVQTSEYNSGTKYPIISQEEKLVSGYCDAESLLYHIDRPVVIFGDHTRALKYVDFDFIVGADGVKILIPKDFLKTKFLLYYLQWCNIPNLGYSRHYKLLKEINVPTPHLDIQQSIVAELDKINELIGLKKSQLSDLDSLAQSIFYDMFGDPVENEKGWEVKKLGEVCTAQNGLVNPQEKPYSEMYHIGPANIISHTGELVELKFAKDENLKSGKYLFDKGMVLYSKIRPNLNKVAKATFKGICSADMYPLIPMDFVTTEYLLFALKTKRFLDYAVSNSGRANIPKINREALMAFTTPLPPLPLQQSFAARITAIEQQKQRISASIKDLETLQALRMQYWFD